MILFSRNGPLDKEVEHKRHHDTANAYMPIRNRSNRYLQNRESMKTESYSGMGLIFQDHDTCVAEGMGPVLDRIGEHLMPSDVAIVVGRKLMLKALQDIEEGKDPPNVIRESRLNHFPDVVTTSGFISSSANWKEQYSNLAEKIDGQSLTPPATASNDKILANE